MHPHSISHAYRNALEIQLLRTPTESSRWTGTIPGDIGRIFAGLNKALGDEERSNYAYRGVDELAKALDNNQIAKAFLSDNLTP
ncbi:MAG: hypothetical protein DMG21_12120 [Acidobacteria bacterium]|nr:MAG: hypothetical protein DMG21_12120 [Acidobacteriota bacterium]